MTVNPNSLSTFINSSFSFWRGLYIYSATT